MEKNYTDRNRVDGWCKGKNHKKKKSLIVIREEERNGGEVNTF